LFAKWGVPPAARNAQTHRVTDRIGVENLDLSARTGMQEFLERKPGEHRSRSGGGAQRQHRCEVGDDAIVTKAMREEERSAGRVGSGHTEVRPTPIWVSKPTRTVLLLGGLVLVLLTWVVPSVPVLINVGRARIGLGHLSFRLLGRSPSHKELLA
jgi:hypothetical protein